LWDFFAFGFTGGSAFWLSRPESWFDCWLSRSLLDSASPPFAFASPPNELCS